LIYAQRLSSGLPLGFPSPPVSLDYHYNTTIISNPEFIFIELALKGATPIFNIIINIIVVALGTDM
jgi:hypothetical protein